MVYMSLVVNSDWSMKSRCYRSFSVSRDIIGCEDCKKGLVGFDPSFVSQKSVGVR